MNILKKDFKEDRIILLSAVIVTLLLIVPFGFDGAYISISVFTIFIGSGIISKEKDKMDFLFSKPISMEKLFFLKLLTSALYILILFASAFIVIGLIIEFRRSCFACSSYITYFYQNPSNSFPDITELLYFFSFIPALFSIPLFFSVLTYNLPFSFLLGSIVFLLIKFLQTFFIDAFCSLGGVFWFYFFISAIFLILSYGVFKRKKVY